MCSNMATDGTGLSFHYIIHIVCDAGLECFLPPPPPPPPTPLVALPKCNSLMASTEQQQQPVTAEETTTGLSSGETAINLTSLEPTSFANLPVPTPYIMHPTTMQPQTPGQPAAPWWVPTEADTSELYGRWYDTTYKAAAATIASPTIQVTGKAKNKYYKRKNEFIDPAQDAEKVASAQRELSALMKPLKCDLCNAVMNSTLQAKLHYDGKPHQKKVSMFLNQSVKKQKTEDGQITSTTNDWQNYCDICKTWFTSQTDATQHYAGKKHIRAANGGRRSRPSKKSQNQNQYSQIDPTNRFGIGMAFQTEATPAAGQQQPVVPESGVTQAIPPTTPAPGAIAATGTGTGTGTGPGTTPTATAAPGTVYTPPTYPTPLRCDLCGVSANRQDQLETHKRGARHLRMLRLNGLPVPDPGVENETTPATPGPIDYSIYRTPSGQYYCAPCNLSLNSESTFAQHVESKKHKNQSNPKSPSNSTMASKKARFKKK
ncbi:zinc finger protein 385B-like isoform X3 [Osmia bicornis bicornis]|uniref:zinc finger protein 385B-like isoform X3 n=1 Tax=Osmia bicornis bicornis TaxID=1437191 RepID=UPI001EAED4D9|nr:zinc finger protein 385B-like isoform X3 [Osmia bicornis bicornis]